MLRDIVRSKRVLFAFAVILAASLTLWWSTRTSVEQPSIQSQPFASTATPSNAEPLESGQRTFVREDREHHKNSAPLEIRVVSSRGEWIEGAEVYHASRLPRVRTPQTCTYLGSTDPSGVLNVPNAALLGHIWAVRGETSTSVVQHTDPAVLRVDLVLSPAHSVSVLCEDLDGEPLPEVCVMLSRLPVPQNLRSEALLTEAFAGPDPISAVRALRTDRSGRAVFSGVVAGDYAISIASPYFELLEREQPRIVVPGGELRLRLAPLLGAVILARGDVILSHSAMLADGCLGGRPSRLNLPEAARNLRAEYPGAVVIVSGNEKSMAPCSQFVLHVLLERGGPVSVPVLLQPLYAGMVPTWIEPVLGPVDYPTASFEVSIQGPTGTTLESGLFTARRMIAGQPQHVSIPAQGWMRLPLGRWEIGTNWELLKGQFEPTEFEVVEGRAPLVIRLPRELVPVRIFARGYGGDLVTSALLRIFAHGKHLTMQRGDLTRSEIWLPSGSVRVSISAPGHKEQSITIEVMAQPGGAVMEVPIELEWAAPAGEQR